MLQSNFTKIKLTTVDSCKPRGFNEWMLNFVDKWLQLKSIAEPNEILDFSHPKFVFILAAWNGATIKKSFKV